MTEAEPRGLEQALMTLRQAAERTGLSATTLRRYIKSGRLRARLIPGRYGPEYVVDDDALKAAGVESRDDGENRSAVPAAAAAGAALQPAAPTLPGDSVPGLLYRELMMKHEHLLVQYGMLRVSGQQLYEVRQAAEERAQEARRAAEELRRTQTRHAREIGELKTELRRAELQIAQRNEQIRELERELAGTEMRLRNQVTAHSIDEEFSRKVQPAPPTEH